MFKRRFAEWTFSQYRSQRHFRVFLSMAPNGFTQATVRTTGTGDLLAQVSAMVEGSSYITAKYHTRRRFQAFLLNGRATELDFERSAFDAAYRVANVAIEKALGRPNMWDLTG